MKILFFHLLLKVTHAEITTESSSEDFGVDATVDLELHVLLSGTAHEAANEGRKKTEEKILLFLSSGTSHEAANERRQETEEEVLFLLTSFAECIKGKWSQLLKEWTSNLHDVTEVLEIFLVLSSGTSHEAANERRQETEEEVFLFLVPSETS